MKKRKKKINKKSIHIKPLNILSREEMDNIYGGLKLSCRIGNDTPGGSGGGGGGGGGQCGCDEVHYAITICYPCGSFQYNVCASGCRLTSSCLPCTTGSSCSVCNNGNMYNQYACHPIF